MKVKQEAGLSSPPQTASTAVTTVAPAEDQGSPAPGPEVAQGRDGVGAAGVPDAPDGHYWSAAAAVADDTRHAQCMRRSMDVQFWLHNGGEFAQTIWQRLPQEELFRARRVSPVWRDGIAALACWTPIVPPPGEGGGGGTDGGCDSRLQVFAEHGKWCKAREQVLDDILELRAELVELGGLGRDPSGSRMKRLQKKIGAKQAHLRAQCSAYDSWAAIAPFTRTKPDEDVSWLRGALGLNEPASHHRRGRSAGQAPPQRCYFQTRERDAGEAFRTWQSTSVQEFMLRDFDEEWVEECDRRVRLVVAHADADGLSAHNPKHLEQKIALAERVLRCYLQPLGSYDVQRGEEVHLRRGLGDLTRICLQGTGAVQLDATEALRQHVDARRHKDDNDRLIQRQMRESTPTYIVAPHLWGAKQVDLAWFFSAPLRPRGWVISTHQFDQTNVGYTPAQRLHGFVKNALYSTLPNELCGCENSPCAMNNADGEHRASACGYDVASLRPRE
jgi:hypothetical protein